MAVVVFTPAARADLARLAAFIAEDSPSHARAFIVRIRERCAILATWPRRGRFRPEISPEVRSFPVSPVVIFYRLDRDDTRATILRVIDGRRDLETVFFDE